MDLVLWVVQALLSLAFLGAGFSKLRDDRLTYAATRPPMTSYAEDLSDPVYKGIGVLEVLGAAGLLLPWATGIAPVLTPSAALGLAVIMAAAIVVHIRRGERAPIVVNVVLLLLSLVVLVGRGLEVLG